MTSLPHSLVARPLRETDLDAVVSMVNACERSFDRGYASTALSTDSRTGALSLYERIGMRVHRSFTRYGRDLSSRSS